ncbi:MAG: hypothetical protein ABSA03_18505 [Streptosporangiaceae bacterium]
MDDLIEPAAAAKPARQAKTASGERGSACCVPGGPGSPATAAER